MKLFMPLLFLIGITGCSNQMNLSDVYYHMDGTFTADYAVEEILADGSDTGVVDQGNCEIFINQYGPATTVNGPDGLNPIGYAIENGVVFGGERIYPAIGSYIMMKADGFMDSDMIQIDYTASFWSTSTQTEGEDHIHYIVVYQNLIRTGR